MKKHLLEEQEIERENRMLRGACIYPGENRVDDYLKLCKRINDEVEYLERLDDGVSDVVQLSYVITTLKGFLK